MRMLFPILTVAALLLPLASAHARLGETTAELEARYGPGKVDDKPSVMVTLLPGAQAIRFERPSGKVNVVIFQGKSVSERATLDNEATRKADTETLLKAYAGDSHWTYREKEKRWHRNDGKAVAYFYNANWFVVMDTDYAKACEKEKEKAAKEKAKEKGTSNLKGF